MSHPLMASDNHRKMWRIRFLSVALTLALFFPKLSLALQNPVIPAPRPVIPSHLFDNETGWTLGKRQLVIFSRIGNTRIEYGITPRLEARLDTDFLSILDQSTRYLLGITTKYGIVSTPDYGFAAQVSVAQDKVIGFEPTQSIVLRSPFSIKWSRVTLATSPRIGFFSGFGPNSSVAGELGTAITITSLVDFIAEFSLIRAGGNTDTAYLAGPVLKLAPGVSIPVILVAHSPGNTALGIVTIVASIGIQL